MKDKLEKVFLAALTNTQDAAAILSWYRNLHLSEIGCHSERGVLAAALNTLLPDYCELKDRLEKAEELLLDNGIDVDF